MNKITTTFTFLFSFSVSFCTAQGAFVNDFKSKLQNAKTDSTKCIALLNLIENTAIPEQTGYFNSLKHLAAKNISATKNTNSKNFYLASWVNALNYSNLAKANSGNLSIDLQRDYHEALKIACKIKDYNLIAMTYNNIGLYYYQKGDIPRSLKNYKKSFFTLEQHKMQEGKSYVLNNIASIYQENNDYKLALKYYRQCINKYTIENEKSSLITIYNNIGTIYSIVEKIDSAFIYKQKAVDLAIELSDKKEEITARNNIGIDYVKKKNYKKALANYSIANNIAKEIGFKAGYVISQCRLSELFRVTNNINKALVHAKMAMENAKLIRSPDMINRSAYQLVLIYEKLGNYKEAYNFKNIYLKHLDSVKNSKFEKEVIQSQYQQQYKTKAIADSLATVNDKKIGSLQLQNQKTQKQYFIIISLLVGLFSFFLFRKYKQAKSQNLQIKNQKIIIEKSLSEKEILLKEIHHRVKNNLQVISSLLGLQSAKIDDENLKSIFAESKNKINTISLIHQKLYQNDDLAEIDMNDYFESLYTAIASVFRDSKPDIVFELETNQLKFDIDTSVPLGLIFNELITNSMKYAFKEIQNGTIKVELKNTNNNKYELIIADNGIGFDENAKTKKSLGLNLVSMLATQLNGKFVSKSVNGTKNTLTFEDTNQRKLSE